MKKLLVGLSVLSLLLTSVSPSFAMTFDTGMFGGWALEVSTPEAEVEPVVDSYETMFAIMDPASFNEPLFFSDIPNEPIEMHYVASVLEEPAPAPVEEGGSGMEISSEGDGAFGGDMGLDGGTVASVPEESTPEGIELSSEGDGAFGGDMEVDGGTVASVPEESTPEGIELSSEGDGAFGGDMGLDGGSVASVDPAPMEVFDIGMFEISEEVMFGVVLEETNLAPVDEDKDIENEEVFTDTKDLDGDVNIVETTTIDSLEISAIDSTTAIMHAMVVTNPETDDFSSSEEGDAYDIYGLFTVTDIDENTDVVGIITPEEVMYPDEDPMNLSSDEGEGMAPDIDIADKSAPEEDPLNLSSDEGEGMAPDIDIVMDGGMEDGGSQLWIDDTTSGVCLPTY
jgi:hypothetical protein